MVGGAFDEVVVDHVGRVVGAVAHGSDDEAGFADGEGDVRDGCALHLHAIRRAVGDDSFARGAVGHETVSRGDAALAVGALEDAGAGAGAAAKREERRVALEKAPGGEVFEHHGVLVVEAELARGDDVERAQAVPDRAADAGVEDKAAAARGEEPGGAGRGVDLAHAATGQGDAAAAERAEGELRAERPFDALDGQLRAEQRDLAVKRAQNAPGGCGLFHAPQYSKAKKTCQRRQEGANY